MSSASKPLTPTKAKHLQLPAASDFHLELRGGDLPCKVKGAGMADVFWAFQHELRWSWMWSVTELLQLDSQATKPLLLSGSSMGLYLYSSHESHPRQ